MATWSWTITHNSDDPPRIIPPTGGSGAVVHTVAVQVSETDIERIIAAYRTMPGYDTVTVDGVTRPTTDDEVEFLIIKNNVQAMLANAVGVEQRKAASDAMSGVPPINVNPAGEDVEKYQILFTQR